MKYTIGKAEYADEMAWLIMEAMSHDCCRWFMGEGHTLEEFHTMMTELVKIDNSLYSYKHVIMAVDTDNTDAIPPNNSPTLAGICLCYDGSRAQQLRLSFENEMLKRFRKDYSRLPYETQTGEFYIDTLCVKAEYRGLGIATTLLKKAIQKGKSLSLPSTLLVDEGNPQAEKLYHRVGFKFHSHDVWGGHSMKRLIYATAR